MISSFLTVIEPAPTYDLTTLETLKEELDITNSSQDNKLRRWIKDASGQVSDYLGRVLAQEKVAETFIWDGSNSSTSLRLRRRPIVSIDSIVADGASLDLSNIKRDNDAGLLYQINAGWTANTVTITYTAGYELLDGLPRAIEKATLVILKMQNSSGSRDPTIRSETIGPNILSTTYWVGQIGQNGSIPPEAIDLLRPHRDLIA